MQKVISLEQLQRFKDALDGFADEVNIAVRTSAQKTCRADRTLRKIRKKRYHVKSNLRSVTPSTWIFYDTKENRWVCFLLSSLQTHFSDLIQRYTIDPAGNDLLDSINAAFSEVLSHPCLPKRRNLKPTPEDVSILSENYRALYHSYVILKYALSEIESELEIGLSAVNWAERDVLVGSFGSEEQFRHNLAKKYYYAPERHFDPTCFPIRYVALYQSAHFKECGICYYGEVKAIRRVKRKKIRFGVRKNNGEEGYYLFRIKEWKRLSSPIEIQDEGVFAPKYTNMFLLMHCQKTYELFQIRSEREYRCYRQIRRILAYSPWQADWKERYPIEGGKWIWVHDGHFDLLDERERLMLSISALDFLQHPTNYLQNIFECVARQPEPLEVPLWVIRENEAYEEKYGVPYREEE